MKKSVAFFVFFLYSFFLFGQASEARKKIRQIMNESPVAGLSVAVVKDNKIIYKESFGYKNLETKDTMTNDNILRIASISKSFTAASLMQLAAQHKISLQGDISKLVGFTVRNPHFPDSVITLAHLLSHRSSINDSEGYFTLDAINPDKNPNWKNCYNNYAPGSNYQYCNLNFNMAGTILERVSGERFDLYVKKHILDKLGVYGGYCVDSLDKTRFANIYEYNPDSLRFLYSPGAYNPRSEEIRNYVMGYSTPIFSPTGGMKISASGLANVMIMHMNEGKYKGKRIISKKYARRMQAPWPGGNYGFAIETTDKLIEGKTLKGHTGSAYGLFSAMFFSPREKFGIVVISNGCDPAYDNGYNAVIRKTVNVLYESLIKK